MDLAIYAGNKLRYLRESKRLRQEDLADRMGIKKQTISRYETGERKMNQDVLFELAEIFNVTIDEFFPPRDVTVKRPTNHRVDLVPIVGRIAAGTPTYAEEDILGYMALPPEQKKKDGLMYLEVTSDSMDMKFPVGSYVLIDTQTQIENGDIAAVKLNGEEATLKKVKFLDDSKSVMLIPQSHNEDYYPTKVNIEETRLHLIGKAVGMYLSM